MRYILIKKETYYGVRVHGIVDDEATAKRWVNWAHGDYIPVAEGAPIVSDEPLQTQSDIEYEAHKRDEKTLKLADAQ